MRILSILSLAVLASAHGNITSPPARLPGPGMASACGQPAVDSVLADGTTPLEDVNVTGASRICNLSLCRGAVFDDNKDRVQTYTPGQTVRMLAELPIPHAGPMNVSIINTTSNEVIGAPLIRFETYADEALPMLPANNTDFNVTMPVDLLKDQCTQPGQCTLQWFWVGTQAKQTYESCVDFVIDPAAPAATAAPLSFIDNAGAGAANGRRFTSRLKRFMT